MIKGKTTIVKLMVSLVLALALCLGTATPAFATGYSSGSEDADATAAITKKLTYPAGMTTPDKAFTFKITPVEVDKNLPSPDNATPTNMPYFVNGVTISFDSGFKVEDNGNGTKTAIKQGNIFAGVTWPHAGVYVYTVTEEGGGGYYKYSKAQYEFTVYVANKSDDSGVYIHAISAKRERTDEDGTPTGNTKTDPTPGTGSGDKPWSEVEFNNAYDKNIGGTDPREPADHIMQIKKEVTGIYGNRTMYFDFLMIVQAPGATSATYRAYIIEKVGTDTAYKVVTGTDNGIEENLLKKDGTGLVYFDVNANSSDCYFKLKHDQMLVFVDMALGTTCLVTEPSPARYKANVAFKTVDAFGDLSEDSTDNIIAGFPCVLPVYLIANDILKDGGNRAPSFANFTNELPYTAPTGISVDNLPYVMLIVFALAALAGYAVFRARKTAAKAGK